VFQHSNDTENLVLLVELLHGVGGARRLITVIGRDQLEHPAFHAAGLVGPVESRIDPELHLASEFLAEPENGAAIPNRIS